MRKYKVEAFRQCEEPKTPEIIEADAIRANFGAVEFLKNDARFESVLRTFAIRMNCNVTEIPEEK